MEVLECVLYQMWIALLVTTVSSESNMKVFIRFCLVFGLDIGHDLTSGICQAEFLLAS